MPTSSYMPDLKVEIAFDGGFRVPKSSWTWTDVSAYVELAAGLSINWGRGDERSTADANTLSLTLDNSDGRFTAGRVGALVLNGTSPGRASTPDAAALDITGDLDLRAHVAMDDWTPAALSALVGKWVNAGDQRSYLLTVETTGVLRFFWSTAGTGASTLDASSTVAPTVSNGEPLWVRATLDVDNGAGGRNVKFYTSPDGETWTQLGSTVTTAGVTSVFSGTAEAAVGASAEGTANRLSGRVFSAEIRNGIDGTIVANPDFTIQETGATSFADSTGKTWTITSPATIDGTPYYPNVVLYKPIRVLATPVDGAQSHRFLGYVTSWPVEWEDTDAYAKATITASSRLARLGLNAAWRSLIEEMFLADVPVAYYPLGDPEGSTVAADVSGLGADPLTMVGAGTDVVFGQATGPGTDSLTAATFAAGKYLSGPAGPVAAGAAWSIDCFFSTSTVGPATILALSTAGRASGFSLDSAGLLVGEVDGLTDDGQVITGSSVADGATHHAALTLSAAGSLNMYLDGALVGTDTATGGTAFDGLTVGGGPVSQNGLYISPDRLTGVVAHAAVYDTELSAARVLAHATAGLTAWAGETTDTRFERYAAMGVIDAAEVSAEAGSTTVGHIDTTDQQIVDMLRTIERTEAGVMFDARDGTLTLHNRAHRYAATAAVTLDMDKDEVEADYSPRLDASALFNDITVTGATSAHLKDDDSIQANGLATASFTTASEDDDEPLNLAAWARLQFATPKPRVPSLTVDALAQVGKTVNCAAVMAVTLGDKVTVTNHPTQAQATTSSYFVEGGTEVYGPESLTITWNVSPSSPDDLALIVGDATRGVVGTNYVAL